jgi:UPF0716 protein FxsA
VFAVLALLFLVVPFVELFILIKVGSVLGAIPTIVLLLLVSIVGAWLVKREGLAVLRRAQEQVRAGQVPATEVVDGLLILFAGALLLTPGFLSDVFGVLLLIPPVRVMVRALTARQLAKRASLRLERW